MAKTHDELFVQEFNAAVKFCPRKITNIMQVPLPEIFLATTTLDTKVCEVRGLLENEVANIFHPLEGTSVTIDSSIQPVRRKFSKTGEILHNEVERVPIPTDSVLVKSPIRLDIPYKYKCSDHLYGYVDCWGSAFLYYLPKSVLYPVNFTALAISTRKLKSYYAISLRLSDYTLIYMSVIPYKPGTTYSQTRVLEIKDSVDYAATIETILTWWVVNQVLQPIDAFQVQGTNLLYQDVLGDYEGFERASNEPLKDLGDSLPELEESLSDDSEELEDLPPEPDEDLSDWA